MTLHVGMLWFDDSKERTLLEKVERAARYYETKYGCAPNVCYLHTGAPSDPDDKSAIKLMASPEILPHHFWLGVDGQIPVDA